MANDKSFLTYNQQMKKLRKDKKIDCNGTPHKISLVRSGYFNMINGYKTPFTCGTDANGNHTYFPNTTLSQINSLKKFDESLRIFLLKYITQVEEEVRTLTGYKFDQCNDNGKIPWYETNAYSSNATLQSKMNTISSAYSELSKSKSEYVQFYMKNHEQIPTWIMIKVVNFSTFIDVLHNSKTNVTHAICKLYSMYDDHNLPNVKLLIGSLHWLRRVRNSCAHNERVYCIHQTQARNNSASGRILDPYYAQLPTSYSRCTEKNIFDILRKNGKMTVVDWAHATQGNASADAAMTYLLFALKDQKVADLYLKLFCKKSDTAMQYVQQWLPIVAAAQLSKENELEKDFLMRWIDVVDYQ